MTATKAETDIPPEILDVYQIARAVSVETRQQVHCDLDGLVFDPPAARVGRASSPSVPPGRPPAARLWLQPGDLLPEPGRNICGPCGARTKALLAAVADLAEFTPEYEPHELEIPVGIAQRMGWRRDRTFHTWTPTAASVARLDELRVKVRLKLIELDSLYEAFPDPLAHACSPWRRGLQLTSCRPRLPRWLLRGARSWSEGSEAAAAA